MDWSNERYIRLYVRDTKTWILLQWEGQAVLSLLLRKCDRAGILDDVFCADDLVVVLANGIPPDVAERGLQRLLRLGVIVQTDTGLFVPNFLPAQESAASDAQRKRAERENRAAAKKLESVTKRDSESQNVIAESQNVTKSHELSQRVTARHSASQPVTPCCADPVLYRADPVLIPCCTDIETNGRSSAATKSLQEDRTSKLILKLTNSETKTKEKKKKDLAATSSPPTGSAVWAAYSAAYLVRYGVAPIRNAKSNTLCKRLCALLPAEDAPGVAEYYLTTRANPYAQSGHCLDLLVRDAGKIHTEWLTGRRITYTGAVEADRLQKTHDDWAEIIAEHAEKEKNK